MDKTQEKRNVEKMSNEIADLLIDWQIGGISEAAAAHVVLSCGINLAYQSSDSKEEAREVIQDYISMYIPDENAPQVH
jgi:hypothetical protein|tara:strand:- start:430 stop:663 length:234 start_codon:yes stop_codon:yes gene_type:complete